METLMPVTSAPMIVIVIMKMVDIAVPAGTAMPIIVAMPVVMTVPVIGMRRDSESGGGEEEGGEKKLRQSAHKSFHGEDQSADPIILSSLWIKARIGTICEIMAMPLNPSLFFLIS
jgi:hypothetical protein